MPIPVTTFEIQAEFLHLYIGRRAQLSLGGVGKVPFRIAEVQHHPETSRILVAIETPVMGMYQLAFDADAIVEVEHELV
jgi:hypothetical protein